MSDWRRFERGSRTGADDQFWSVRLRGRMCDLQYGWIGHPPTEETREYPRESAARSAVKQKIKSRLRRGWIEVEELDDARTRALERGEAFEVAIGEDPSSLDNWAVYADFLQQFEPLLGERIALGLALERAESDDDRARLQAEIERLETARARELFGVTLAGALPQRYCERSLRLERRFGMIVGAWMHVSSDDIIKFDGLARVLLELPLARTLVDFHVDPRVGSIDHMRIAQMLVARRRPVLRRLTFGRADSMPDELPLPLFQRLLDRLPNLERLELHGSFRGAAAHPSLRELKYGRPDETSRLDIVDWRFPGLETLHLRDPGRVDWSRVELPRLERLLIDWMEHGDELVASLARAPLLRQLRSLVIVGSDLSGRGIHTMLDNAEAFASVGHILVLDALVNPGGAARLRQRLPNVQLAVDDGREDPEGMYVPSRAEYDELTRF